MISLARARVNALSNRQLRSLLTDASLVSWLHQGHAAELFADGLFVDAIRQAEFIDAFKVDGFEAAYRSPQFEAALFNR